MGRVGCLFVCIIQSKLVWQVKERTKIRMLNECPQKQRKKRVKKQCKFMINRHNSKEVGVKEDYLLAYLISLPLPNTRHSDSFCFPLINIINLSCRIVDRERQITTILKNVPLQFTVLHSFKVKDRKEQQVKQSLHFLLSFFFPSSLSHTHHSLQMVS